MSKTRHAYEAGDRDTEDGITVRTFAVRHVSAYTIPPHSHDWHQLIYATEGVMWVHTAQGDWVIPPNRAVWVPAGIEHSIQMVGMVLVQTVYLARGTSRALPRRCCAVNVSPLLRELVVQIIKLGTLSKRIAVQARAIAFLVDQLCALPTAPLQLPVPVDERARRVATWLRAHPNDASKAEWVAERASTSVRTLERLFQRETGMTFGKWRQQLRLLNALQFLASGRSVTAVAMDVGYDSTSAFIATFKRFFGTTPSRYFD